MSPLWTLLLLSSHPVEELPHHPPSPPNRRNWTWVGGPSGWGLLSSFFFYGVSCPSRSGIVENEAPHGCHRWLPVLRKRRLCTVGCASSGVPFRTMLSLPGAIGCTPLMSGGRLPRIPTRHRITHGKTACVMATMFVTDLAGEKLVYFQRARVSMQWGQCPSVGAHCDGTVLASLWKCPRSVSSTISFYEEWEEAVGFLVEASLSFFIEPMRAEYFRFFHQLWTDAAPGPVV